MEDEHTNGKKLARNGHNTVIYKGTFVSNHSLSSKSGKSSFGPRVQHDVSAGKQPESKGYYFNQVE